MSFSGFAGARALDQVSVVHVHAESPVNRGQIGPEAVGRDLRASYYTFSHVLAKVPSCFGCSLADSERGHQLCIGINRHKDKLATQEGGIFRAYPLVFLAYIG